MLKAVEQYKFLFEWNLQDMNLSTSNPRALFSSPKFSFQDCKFDLFLLKREGEAHYGYYLRSLEASSKPGKIHFRLELVKRMDNIVVISSQGQRERKEMHRGVGLSECLHPTSLRDFIFKVKMWTSEYDFEYDLENINTTKPSFSMSSFIIGDKILSISSKKNKEGTKYDCLLMDVNSNISSRVCLQVDLFKRIDNRLVKSDKCQFSFKKDEAQGFVDWFNVEKIRDHVLKVKVLIFKPFSDFVEKPIGFESHGYFLFNKMACNLSFLVGEEVVFVIHAILASRSDYFRAMLEGSFKEAQVPMTVESNIPIQGIDVDAFKMIIEWIYTMDIKRLNDPFSPSLLVDIQYLYVAADMYLLPDLCGSIGRYLNHLLSFKNFGEIYQVAKKIGSESLEKDVLRSWISKSDSFNENEDQINALICGFDSVEVEDEDEEGAIKEGGEEELSDTAIIGIQRKMIAASSWDGESESKLSVVKCLASLLSVGTGTKKRKILCSER
jgi:hypothetical protein